MNILITKTLTKQQKDWLSASFNEFNFSEEALINSYQHSYEHFVNNYIDKLATCKQWIFTSRNAVKAVANYQLEFPKTVYAVGSKTAAALQELSCEAITPLIENAKALASTIIEKNTSKEKMAFFCGNMRRNELPEALNKAGIPFEELLVYSTTSLSKKINTSAYDILFFFSPSAVESFASSHTFPSHIHYIAIGPTTAQALQKHKIKHLHTAKKPNIEKMMDEAVKLK